MERCKYNNCRGMFKSCSYVCRNSGILSKLNDSIIVELFVILDTSFFIEFSVIVVLNCSGSVVISIVHPVNAKHINVNKIKKSC